MASRIMHLAIATALLDSLGEQIDADGKGKGKGKGKGIGMGRTRFLFGSLLPDASATKASHFPVYRTDERDGSRWKTFDLAGFRQTYASEIRNDPLFLGYYLHLLQDILFRKRMYGETPYDPHVPGNIPLLYEDYRIVGSAVIRSAGLTPPAVPDRLETADRLLNRFPFRISAFADELKKDFAQSEAHESGQTTFLHMDTAERFIEEAAAACRAEAAWIRGERCGCRLDGDGYWWRAERK